MMAYLLVFASNVIIDILSVLFVKEVTKKNRVKAGLVSVAIVSLYAFSMIYIIDSISYLIPATMGAFIGTFITVGRK